MRQIDPIQRYLHYFHICKREVRLVPLFGYHRLILYIFLNFKFIKGVFSIKKDEKGRKVLRIILSAKDIQKISFKMMSLYCLIEDPKTKDYKFVILKVNFNCTFICKSHISFIVKFGKKFLQLYRNYIHAYMCVIYIYTYIEIN